MGNVWRRCICGSRQANHIHPINSRSLALDVGNIDAVSLCGRKKHLPREKQEITECPPHCVVQEHDFNALILQGESLITEAKCDKETEVETKDNEPGREDCMTEWLTSIAMQNALPPSYVTFNNKRHLLMRSKFTKMIQRMNYSNSILESNEDEIRMVHVQPRNILSGISICPQELDLQMFQFSVRQAKAFPVRVPQGTQRYDTRTEELVYNNSVGTSYSHVNRTSVLPPPRHAVSGSVVCEGGTSSNDRSKISSEFPGRPFQISSNWLDEDFEENILKDPTPFVENGEKPKATEEPPLHGPKASHEPELTDTSRVLSVKNSRAHDPETEVTMGLFLSTLSTETTHDAPAPSHRFSNLFNKRKNRSSRAVYSTDVEDSSWR